MINFISYTMLPKLTEYTFRYIKTTIYNLYLKNKIMLCITIHKTIDLESVINQIKKDDARDKKIERSTRFFLNFYQCVPPSSTV